MTENCHSVMNLVVSTTETLLLHAHTLSYTSSSAGSCVSTAVQSSTAKLLALQSLYATLEHYPENIHEWR